MTFSAFKRGASLLRQCTSQAPHRALWRRHLRSADTDAAADETQLDAKQLQEFKRYLRNSKTPFKDGHTCLQLPCRLCTRDDPAVLAYINKRTGTFTCPSCDVRKTGAAALQCYETGQRFEAKDVPDFRSSSTANVTPVSQEICDELGIRGLRATDVADTGAYYNASTGAIHFPLRNAAGQVVGEKLLNVGTRTETTVQHEAASGLLVHGPVTKTKAIVVSNLLDFLVLLMQRPDNHCLVCLPYFLRTLPPAALPGLERFKELTFWFNFESADWGAARSFAQKMDEKRCLLIRPTETEPTAYEAHRKRLNLRHILQKALPVQHKSITTFSSLRNDILSELQNIEKVNGVKWKRFPTLNKLLKGHRKGELTILTGPTGSGKTTFMSEYSLDLALQGVSTLWGSFEIRNARLAATLLRQYVGYSLEKRINEFDHWATEFERFPLYFMTFHGQQQLKVVMEAIEHAQYVHDINHVIIDNLQFMMGLSGANRTDKFWEQDAIIAAFRSLATKHNVHVTLVMHPRKEREEDDLTTSSIFGSAKATQEADNVLIIQDKRLTALRGKKYLQIVKNRYSGDLGIMPLEFDKDSLSYSSIHSSRRKKEKEKATASPT